MQIVEIRDPDRADLFCPFCGRKTLEAPEGVREACEHLLYVSCSETIGEPWFVREGSGDYEREEEDDSEVDMLAGVWPSAEAVLFLLSFPAPSGMEVYVLYLASLD